MSTTKLFRLFFLTAFIILFYAILTAQVKIKERVEIEPLSPKISEGTSGGSPAKVHLEFTAETDVTIRLACPYETVYGNHTVSADVCIFDEFYYYQVSCFELSGPVQIPYRFTATVGAAVLFDYQGTWDLGPSTYGYSGDRVWLKNPFAYFRVGANENQLCEGGQSLINFGFYYLKDCSTDDYFLLDIDPMTLTVTHGQELGRLFLDNEYAGSSLTFFPYHYRVHYDLGFRVYDILPEDVVIDTVEIKIQDGGLIEIKRIPIRACSRGTSFDFSAAKPKIYIRTQDALSIQPIIDNSSTVWDKKTDPVTFTITSGSEYGGFTINGQKQEGTSITLQGTQLDQLSFFACDSLPNGVTEGSVTIQASSKGIVKDVSLIILPTSKLKLTLDLSPASIEYGGYTTATAQTVNIDTEAPEAPPGDVTYNFALTQGSEFARFYEYDGGGGGSASIASLSKTSSTNENNTHKLKRSRILAKSVSKGLNKSNKDEVKYSIKSSLSATTLDNGGPDVLQGVAQSDGDAYVWPEATDQEPLNPDGEVVQVVVSASDPNITSASGSFLVKSSCIVVSVTPSTIKQGETATIIVQKKNAFGGLEDLSADDYVEFEITTGANAGQLGSPDGSQTGGYIGGAFQSATFTSNVDPSLPDDNPIRICVYTDYCSGLGKLTVTNNACMQIKHALLSVGDTTGLSIVYTESGSPVPADKSLNISISGGGAGENGFLLVGGSIGTRFTGVKQPIQYIAPPYIQGDSLIVPIDVSKNESSGGGGISASTQQKDSLKISIKKNTLIRSSILSECVTEDVTIKKKCANIKFDVDGNPLEYPGLRAVPEYAIKVEQKNDNDGCNRDPNATGATHVSSGYTISPGAPKGSFYITELTLKIEWGYCLTHINSIYNNPTLVDEVNNYPQNRTTANAMITDFRRWRGPDGRIVVGVGNYYPLIADYEHEHFHINQYKEKYKEIFNKALQEIYDLPLPPSDWCLPENMESWLNTNEKAVNDIIQKAVKEWEKYVAPENDAYTAGFTALQNFITRLQQQPY
jgi:hypothetical protein